MPTRDVDLARAFLAVLPHFGRLSARTARESGTLSLDRFKALQVLAVAGPVRSGELGERCLLSAPAVTHIVDALVADDLVRRAPDPVDGRATLLHVTPRGRRELARTEETIVHALAEVFGRLDAPARAKLREGLVELERTLREESAMRGGLRAR